MHNPKQESTLSHASPTAEAMIWQEKPCSLAQENVLMQQQLLNTHLWSGEKDEVESLHEGRCEGEVLLVLQDAAQHGQHCPAAETGSQLAHHQAAPPLQQPRPARASKPAAKSTAST